MSEENANTHDLVVIDRTDPRGIYNLVPSIVRKTIDAIDPALFSMSEDELKEEIRPDHYVCRLRKVFWKEYDTAQAEFRPISLSNIAGMMAMPLAHINYTFKKPNDLAWILCPPASYEAIIDEALQAGNAAMRKILDITPLCKDGSLDHKLIDQQLKITAYFDMRKNGAIVQKNLHLHASGKAISQEVAKHMSIQDIDEQIKRLENKNIDPNTGKVIDVTK